MTDPLSPIALLAPAIVGTLVNLCSEAGVNRALSTIASRQLSLGNLDANHDIARAARVAQVNAAIVLLRSAQEAEPRTEFINGGYYIPAAVAKSFSVADAKLRRIATRIENADPKEFAGMFGEGALAEVQSAVQLLLATEQPSRYQSARDTLRELALQEVTALGGWTATPKSLSEAFSNFAGAFAASVGALLKSPSFDAFFRILLVLKQEAIDQNIQLILQSLPELSSIQAERTKVAQSIAGGLQKLQAFEDSLVRIAQTVAAIDATTRQTNERVSQFSEKLDQLLALGLTSEERINYKREIYDLKHELGLKDEQAIGFLSTVLKQKVAPQDIAEAYHLATTQFQALVAELNRKSNLPSEVQRDRDAARAALAGAEFEKARTHLTAAAEATRRTAEHAASEYAQSLASLGALAFVELNFSEARRFYGDAIRLPGLSKDRFSRYCRSYLVASNAVMARTSLGRARKVIEEMIAAGVKPDEVTFSTLINLSDNYAEGRKVLEEMVAAGVKPHEVAYNTLINLSDSYVEGRKVLDEMVAAGVKPDEVTFSTLINLSDSYAEGRKVFEEMVAAGVKPNEVTFSTLINLSDNYAEGRKVFEEMVAAGVKPDEVTFSTLINLSDSYVEGRKVLDEMVAAGVRPNEVTLTTLVKKAPTFDVGCLFAVEARDTRDWYTGRGFYQALFSLPIIDKTAEELLAVYVSLPFRHEVALENPISQFRSQKRFEDVIAICLFAPHLPAAQKFYRERFEFCRDYLLGRLSEGIDSDNLHYCLGIACHLNADWERAASHLQIALARAYATTRIGHIKQLLELIP